MSVNQPARHLHPAEKKRTSGIHLVQRPAPRASTVNVAHSSVNESNHIRESERMSTWMLVCAALIAPAIWLGHAVLVWLEVI